MRQSLPTSAISSLSLSSLTRKRRRLHALVLVAVLALAATAWLAVTRRLHRPLAVLVAAASNDHGRQGGECAGWDPDGGPELDPPGCVRARQYRQVQRVLALEQHPDARKHLLWSVTQLQGLAQLLDLLRCFLPQSDAQHRSCPDRPLVITSYWWAALYAVGGTSGETIWIGSVMQNLEALGYTVIATRYELAVRLAELLPDVYHTVWMHDFHAVACLTDPRCVAAEHYAPPLGADDLSVGVPDAERGVIPMWRILVADYFGARPKNIYNNAWYWGRTDPGEWSYHPLGQAWIVTPWDMPDTHVHLPYSIEPWCLAQQPLPFAERANDVLLLAKRSSYFHANLIPGDHWTRLAASTAYRLITTATPEDGFPIPDGIVAIPAPDRAGYERLLGRVRALVGVGMPSQSPSVYSAWCQATPVVVPYWTNTLNLSGWGMFNEHIQHGPALSHGEPYAYAYAANDYAQLEAAVRAAAETPIERYVPDDMRMPFVRQRIAEFMARDNEALFDARTRAPPDGEAGRVPRMPAGVRERCYELGRCAAALPAGVAKPAAGHEAEPEPGVDEGWMPHPPPGWGGRVERE
ncbi:hypothetical protein Q5752_005741 [Cryptotrichosporon argae]